MPVCTECARWWSPRSAASGRCPDCGGSVSGVPASAAGATDMAEAAESTKLPWHLKLLAVSFSLYMGWRMVQGVAWLLDRF